MRGGCRGPLLSAAEAARDPEQREKTLAGRRTVMSVASSSCSWPALLLLCLAPMGRRKDGGIRGEGWTEAPLDGRCVLHPRPRPGCCCSSFLRAAARLAVDGMLVVGRAAKAANSALGDVRGGEEDGTMAATAAVEKGRMG